MSATAPAPLLEVRGLKKYFPIRRGSRRKTVGAIRAVDDVNFSVTEGETLGLVGESGCGKTTTARCILRALRRRAGRSCFARPTDASSTSRRSTAATSGPCAPRCR